MDQDVEVYIYTPLDEGNTSATYRRLEGYLRKLQHEEMARFVRLVKSVRAEKAGEEDDEADADDHDGKEGTETKKLKDMLLERDSQIAKLKKQVKQQDAESEHKEEKTAKLEQLRQKLSRREKSLAEQKALNEDFNNELKAWRDLDAKRASVSRGNAANADDMAAGTREGDDDDDADDDASIIDHDDDIESSVDGAELSKKPGSRTPSVKPPQSKPPQSKLPQTKPPQTKPLPTKAPQSMPPFTPMPRPTRSNSQATMFSGISKKPERTGQTKGGTGAFHYGYQEDDGEAWGINDEDPEKIGRDLEKKSREANAKGSSDPETPANAATGTSAAGDSTGTLAGQTNTERPGRRQSKACARTRKSTNDDANDADNDSDEDFKELRKSISKKKRKAELSDGEDQSTTSKKPRRDARILQSVKEEPEDDGKHARVAKGTRKVSAGPKAKSLLNRQDAKRQVAQDDLAESEGGMSDPICISSAEDTDSDTDDEY
jgi:hypothetical protein